MSASPNFIAPVISSEFAATRVINIIPSVMRWIHTEVRQQKSTCLTIPQLRALAFVQINPCLSLAALAEYLGVTSASTSTMVERLVQKEFLTRAEHPKLRRQVILSLTDAGEEHLKKVRQELCDRIVDKLGHLPADRLENLLNGLEELSQIFV